MELTRKWWSPVISHVALFAATLYAIPAMSLRILNSRSLVLLEIAVFAISVPLLLARWHKASAAIALIAQALMALAIFATWPKEQEGNWKLQIAMHVLGILFLGFMACGVAQSIYLLRKRN